MAEAWKESSIGEHCAILNGFAFKSEDYVEENGILNFRVTNISWNGTIDIDNDIKFLPKHFAEEYKQYLLQKDDILFVMVGATRGKIAQISENILPALMNQNMWRIKPTSDTLDKNFLYLWLRSRIPTLLKVNDDQARGFFKKSDFAAIPLLLPALSEQKKIAAILSTVQRAIEQQEQLIALTTELKKALMHKLFTEGTRGEPQKETEIGLVPESWEVRPLAKLFALHPFNGLYKPKSQYGGGTQILRIDDFSNDGDIVTKASNRVRVENADIVRYSLSTDDIVLNRVNSLSHLGKTAMIGELSESMIFESNMMRFRVDEKIVLPQFVFRYLNSAIAKKQLIGEAKRAIAQSSVNQGDIQRLLVPLPEMHIQREIVDAFTKIEKKLGTHKKQSAVFNSLFQTLLNQLMTAQIRVNNIDLAELGLEAEAQP